MPSAVGERRSYFEQIEEGTLYLFQNGKRALQAITHLCLEALKFIASSFCHLWDKGGIRPVLITRSFFHTLSLYTSNAERWERIWLYVENGWLRFSSSRREGQLTEENRQLREKLAKSEAFSRKWEALGLLFDTHIGSALKENRALRSANKELQKKLAKVEQQEITQRMDELNTRQKDAFDQALETVRAEYAALNSGTESALVEAFKKLSELFIEQTEEYCQMLETYKMRRTETDPTRIVVEGLIRLAKEQKERFEITAKGNVLAAYLEGRKS